MGISTGYGEGKKKFVKKTKIAHKCHVCLKVIPKGSSAYTGFGTYYHVGHEDIIGKAKLMAWRKKHGIK
jgi:hypothetical protein